MGHLPGWLRSTAGCIGQLYVFSFVKSIPHVGHRPGWLLLIAGCMGQAYLANGRVSVFKIGVLSWLVWAKVAKERVKANMKGLIFSLYVVLNDEMS